MKNNTKTMNRAMISILRVLNSELDLTGSREVTKNVRLYGVELAERTVLYHMKILDELGYTEVFGKEGRKITAGVRRELKHGLVSEQVGFVISKIETLSYLTTLNLETMKGSIILNITYGGDSDREQGHVSSSAVRTTETT